MHFQNKRIFAFILALTLVLGLLPSGSFRAEATAPIDTPTEADYARADLVFDRIAAMETSPARRNSTEEQLTQAARELVLSSDSYVENSLTDSGNAFTWWTTDGIQCVYSPRMQSLQKDMTPETGEDIIVNEPRVTRGGSPSGQQVYLIGPYYGYDTSFTNQYKNEARRVAQAIGDTDGYTLYSGAAATIDKVAEAVSNGAVVFFDSHGNTDYENPEDEYDFITGATCSYLCLTTTAGVTAQDYRDGALYDSEGAWINGTNIASHMTKNSPSGILWMAICLGMGTDTICAPLREKGVAVVYGYSEAVTFDGDYLYEQTFWDEMLQGNTVAQSIGAMKTQWGNWDWSVQMANHYNSYDGYSTIKEARDDFMAFPVVVSDEDPFPGKRTAAYQEYNGFYGADSLQTVRSTYTLGELEATTPTTPTDPDTPAADGATLSFATTANRVEWDAQHQLWQQNGITVLNEKAGSSNNVADYADPARFYKGSSLTISAGNMVGIDILCTTSSYASALVTAIPATGGITVQISGSTVSITLPAAANSFLIPELSGGQVRVDAITVYTAGTSDPTEPTDPTEPSEPDGDYVTDPVTGIPYKFRVEQKNTGKVLYLTGEMDGYYFATTENIEDAADVYLETVSGGYRVFLLKEGVRYYLQIVQNGSYTNVEFTTSPTKVLQWNAAIASVTCDVDGTPYYFGAYKNFETLSASDISYVTGENADTFDVTNFVAHFVEAAGSPIAQLPGDLDESGQLTAEDVVVLLLYISMPDLFPLSPDVNADLNGDGAVTASDAIKLLLHISMPDLFPLSAE